MKIMGTVQALVAAASISQAAESESPLVNLSTNGGKQVTNYLAQKNLTADKTTNSPLSATEHKDFLASVPKAFPKHVEEYSLRTQAEWTKKLQGASTQADFDKIVGELKFAQAPEQLRKDPNMGKAMEVIKLFERSLYAPAISDRERYATLFGRLEKIDHRIHGYAAIIESGKKEIAARIKSGALSADPKAISKFLAGLGEAEKKYMESHYSSDPRGTAARK